MRIIIHLSDLHFGKIDPTNVEHLLLAFTTIKPDLVIISGDLTQRARKSQFEDAKIFLDKIKKSGFSYFIIPGNHDISPLYRPFQRMVDPYKRYKMYISENIEPFFTDSEIAVVSLNTVRKSALKGGRVSIGELKKLELELAKLPQKITRILVTHHPLDLPIERPKRKLAYKSKKTISSLSKHTIDLYLSGHYHRSSVITTSERYAIPDYSAIAIQAGTISKRVRGEAASFNVLKIDRPNITIDTYMWNPKNFALVSTKKFVLDKNTWKLENK